MVAPVQPNGVNVQGAVKVVWVEDLTNPDSPSLAEINAATSLDVSLMLYEGGWQPGVTANKVSAKRRLGSRKVFEKFGTTTDTLADLQYSFDPQGAAGTDGRLAYEKFAEGGTGYFVERLGLAIETDMAVGQKVNVYPVVLGPKSVPVDTADEAAEVQITQPVGITGATRLDKAIVA